MGEACSKHMKNTYRMLVARPGGKDFCESRVYMGGQYITMVLKEIGCENVVWIHPIQYRVQWRDFANMVLKLK
jgi:hypothetical protein